LLHITIENSVGGSLSDLF